MRLRRFFARAIARRLPRLMPPHLSEWGEVMAAETEHIESDGAALLFALACLRGAAAERLRGLNRQGANRMTGTHFRRTALAAGAFALAAGFLFMGISGAPATYLIVNGGTALLALVAWPYLRRLACLAASHPAAAAWTCAAALLATAWFGRGVDGVSRWVGAGPVTLQLSFLALPPLIALAARKASPAMAAALALAAAALAMQPDRAMAAALAAALAIAAATAPVRWRIAAFACAAAGTLAAFARPDPMPAVAFVDQVVPHAAQSGIALAALVAAALLTPAALFLRASVMAGPSKAAARALAAGWASFAAAAFLGNYPSPLVGYGASAILGYALSCALLVEIAGGHGRSSETRRSGSLMRSEARAGREDQKRKAVPT